MTFFAWMTAWAEPATDLQKLVAANNAFAFDLMNQVAQAQPDANAFISPYSVSSALQMTADGAAGETRGQMQRALRTAGMSNAALNGAFADLDQQFGARRDVILNLANGLWVQNNYRLKPAFVTDNRKFFQAELAEVDFNQPQSAQAINDWADQKTQGKIKEVVQFPFPPLTRLILANAIYFKGKWIAPFEKSATRPREFHLANGQTKRTPTMTQEGQFAYQETDGFQAVKLPYRGGLQMELYLPQTNSNLRKFIAGIVAKGNWQQNVQEGYRRQEGSVTLPKFKIEYEVQLNVSLEALGMKNAFGPNADFSGIANEPLLISEVKQKSYVDVNEEGTEAAAVTAITMRAAAVMRPPPDRFTMVLDRPFFFVISDVNTGSILFMGVVNEPVGTSGS